MMKKKHYKLLLTLSILIHMEIATTTTTTTNTTNTAILQIILLI